MRGSRGDDTKQQLWRAGSRTTTLLSTLRSCGSDMACSQTLVQRRSLQLIGRACAGDGERPHQLKVGPWEVTDTCVPRAISGELGQPWRSASEGCLILPCGVLQLVGDSVMGCLCLSLLQRGQDAALATEQTDQLVSIVVVVRIRPVVHRGAALLRIIDD